MDPLTHLAGGVMIAHLCVGLAPEPALSLTSIGMALAPDFDFLSRKLPGAAFLRVHHGFTHSFTGVVFQSLIYCSIAWSFFRLELFNLPASPFVPLLTIGLISAFSHVLLDWVMHNNGLPFLHPFRYSRYAFPLILGVNPQTVSRKCHERHFHTCFGCQFRGSLRNPVAYLVTIGAAVGLILLPYRRVIAVVFLAATFGYLLYCYIARERARRVLIAFDPSMDGADAYPGRARPDRWLFVRSAPDSSAVAYLVCSDSRAILHKWQFPQASVPDDLIRRIPRVVQDLKYCIHHLYPMLITDNGYRTLNFRDLSYLYSEPLELGSVRVVFDAQGNIVSEVFQEVWN